MASKETSVALSPNLSILLIIAQAVLLILKIAVDIPWGAALIPSTIMGITMFMAMGLGMYRVYRNQSKRGRW